jgi:hypothetical protein
VTVLISQEEFRNAVRSFQRTAFRLEVRDSYKPDYEREAFQRFLAGSPLPPSELDWWQAWLDQVSGWTREGKAIGRVRVLADPPTDYQRWMLWTTPWHASAGEDIRYIRQATVQHTGLPLEDWWLLDDEQVIVMHFTEDGRPGRKELVTDPEPVARYRTWRAVALRNSFAAERTTAA